MRIFDISDPANPQYVKAIQTPCGSHTHTVVPDPASERSVYLYVDAYSRGASTTCNGLNPTQIVQVDLDDAASASVVKEVQFFDYDTAWGGGAMADGGRQHPADHRVPRPHRIPGAAARGRRAAAGTGCSSRSPIRSIPRCCSASATPTWRSGTRASSPTTAARSCSRMSSGDGFINTCSPAFGYERGADAVYTLTDNVADPELVLQDPAGPGRPRRSARRTPARPCPCPDRFIVAQAWLEGGVSVIDFTDPAAPKELAWYDKPTYGYSKDYTAGSWAVYYYNGYLFSSDMYEGLDVLRPSAGPSSRMRRGTLRGPQPPDAAGLRLGVAHGARAASDGGRAGCAAEADGVAVDDRRGQREDHPRLGARGHLRRRARPWTCGGWTS